MKNSIDRNKRIHEKALKRAFNGTLKWMQSQVIKRATKELGIKRSALKGRWFMDASKRSLWFGLDSVSAHRTGKVRKNKKGVRAALDQYDGAFIMDPNLIMERVGRARLPIDVVTKEVKEQILEVIDDVKVLAKERFKVLYKKEVNYARNHEKY